MYPIRSNQVFPASGVQIANAAEHIQSGLPRALVLPADLLQSVRWSNPQQTTGRLPAALLMGAAATGELDVVKTANGSCLVGHLHRFGRQFEALGFDGRICEHWALSSRGLGETPVWEQASSTAGWAEALFCAERDRFYIHALDVGLREQEIEGLFHNVAVDFHSHQRELAGGEADAVDVQPLKKAWGDVCAEWNPIDQPVLITVLETMRDRLAAAGGERLQVEAFGHLIDFFPVHPHYEGDLRDVIARHRTSVAWWQAAAASDCDFAQRIDLHCRERRAIENDLKRLGQALALKRGDLVCALGPYTDLDVGMLCVALGRVWRSEQLLINRVGFVPVDEDALQALNNNLMSAAGFGSAGSPWPGGSVGQIKALAARLAEPAVHQPLMGLRSLERQYAELGGTLRHAAQREVGLRIEVHGLRTGRAQARQQQNREIITGHLTALFEHLPPGFDREAMGATLREVFRRWTVFAPDGKWSLFRPSVCDETDLTSLLETILIEGVPSVTEARLDQCIDHFEDVFGLQANARAVEVIRHALHDACLLAVEQDLLAHEEGVLGRAKGLALAGAANLDRVLQNGATSFFSVLQMRRDGAPVLDMAQLRSNEAERHSHHLSALNNTENCESYLQQQQEAITRSLNEHTRAGELNAALMDGINGIALTRAVVDQAGASALLNVDMAVAVQAFKKPGNMGAGVIEPLAEWGKRMGQDARDKLTQMSIKTLSWFFSEIDPDMYHVLNHPGWD